MDSSIEELKAAVANLTDYNQLWAPDRTGGADAPGIGQLYQGCNSLSETFKGANDTLSSGWESSAKVLYQIFSALVEVLGDIYDGLVLFTDESYQAEKNELKAVEDANDTAQQISDELSDLIPTDGQ